MVVQAKKETSMRVADGAVDIVVRLLREPAVRETVGNIGKTTLWRWIREGHFPKPVRLGANCVAWRSDEVEAWLASRPRHDEVEAAA